MTPADDRSEITSPYGDAWLDDLHKNPAYLLILDEIDLDSAEPGVTAEKVLAWVESWGLDSELPMPEPE